MPTTGIHSSAQVGIITTQDIPYTTPLSNVQNLDAALITSSTTISGTNHTDKVGIWDFGFSIPAGSTIDIITVWIYDYTITGGSGAPGMELWVCTDTAGGVVVGDGIASPITGYSSNVGSLGDLWGGTWTPADINSANFGVHFDNYRIAAGSPQISIDAVQVEITYTPAATSQYTYPDADNVTTGWTATPLYQKVDEPTTPSDADYITSTAT